MQWKLNRLGFGRRVDGNPTWASFFAPGAYAPFEEEVRAHLDAQGLAYKISRDEGVIVVDIPDADQLTLGLNNIAQRCAAMPRRNWRSEISSHFKALVSAEHKGPDETYADVNEASHVLKARIYPADMAGLEYMVSRELAQGIHAALTLDLPETVVSVNKEQQFEKWGIAEEEAFQIALRNVKIQDAVEAQSFDIGEGASINALIGDSFFTASHAPCLQDYLPPECKLGAIVAIPHRHAVLYHPIVSLKAIHAINALIPMANNMYEKGPGSISPNLYWRRAGTFHMQPSRILNRDVEFMPTDEFVTEALNQLK